jgi:4-amino-4-deoxy-L-arabinose transferase-like glycosyltransferase
VTSGRCLPVAALGLLALCLPLFFWRLADRDLWSSHEARAGMDAQTILDDGSWGLPHLFDGQPELQKPPLYYWLVATLARARGGRVDAWDVRLPAALSALGCALAVLLGTALLRRRPAVGLTAAAILATAVHFTWLARIGRIDMPLTLAVTVAAGCFYPALGRHPRRWALPLGYLAVAAAALLKGPVGAVLPAAILGLHLAVERGLRPGRWWQALRDLGAWWGVPLVLAVALPWFVWAESATGGELSRVFLWYHNIGRGLGTAGLRTNPWWFYGPMFLGDFLPWSPLVLAAGLWCLRRPFLRRDPDARAGLCWFAAVVLVLSCSHFKRADYLLPAYPGAALFLACVLRRWSRRGWAWPVRTLVALGVATMAVVWCVRLVWLLPRQEPARDYRAFAAEVRRRAVPPQPVVFFRTEAHALAFHVGRPLDVLVQWEKLRERLARPGRHYVVLPPQDARECPRQLPGVCVAEVRRNTDLSGGSHERPLVLIAAEPAPPAETTALGPSQRSCPSRHRYPPSPTPP